MKPVLFIRNDPSETFGIAANVFDRVQIWDAIGGQPAPPSDSIGGVVVFGSSYNVEHADEQPFIGEVADLTRDAIDRGVPYVGVCFGAQLLAWAMGGQVTKAPAREVGFEPIRPLPAAGEDRLLSHYAEGDRVFQWHMDTFTLPEGAEPLVRGDAVEQQAYRIGDRAWGVQFHFEVDIDEIRLWLDDFAKQGDLEGRWGKSYGQIMDEARVHLDEHQRKGAEVFRRFADVVREAQA
jgi:GMP synthase (glutamine-hydrolysing)